MGDRSTAASDKATGYRDLFDMQLRFAEAIAAGTSTTIADAVLRYTNLHRRLGFGVPTDNPPSEGWHEYTSRLERFKTHADRLDWTCGFHASSPEEELPDPKLMFGCFLLHVDQSTQTVRLHLYNLDPYGPLQKSRIEQRRTELHALFSYSRLHFPHANKMLGQSWLYGVPAYRRLFPDIYLQSAQKIEAETNFQGMSRWGQFMDHTGRIKPKLQELFLTNLKRINLERLWEVFPMPSYRVSGAIEHLYDYHGVA